MSEPRPPADREAIRALVRQVLRDLLPEAAKAKLAGAAPAAQAPAASAAAPAAGPAKPVLEEVSLSSDAELAAFVRRLLHLFEDAAAREAIRSGRHRFHLAKARRGTDAATAPASSGGVARVAKGPITEGKVVAAAKVGKRLVLGKGVVVTPLARDKARQLGVQIERE